MVAPFTGAWIEMFHQFDDFGMVFVVAPFTGAWIEISRFLLLMTAMCLVAPFTGAWIEIDVMELCDAYAPTSHPSRVRGLK